MIEQCGNDQKKLFKLTKDLMHQTKPASLPMHHNAQHLSDIFAKYFTSKIQKIRSEFPSPGSQSIETEQHHTFPVLDTFEPITENQLKKLIMGSNSKSCHLDPIPTTLLKSLIDVLLPVLCRIINLSLQSSIVPSDFKLATVTPLLKKASLNKEDLKNYRPVSNLPYIAKLTERVVVNQLNSHMVENDLHTPFQSAYRQYHSTETALLRVYNDILNAIDHKNCVMLVLLDLSAAFDTVEHSVLFQRLEEDLGVTGDVLQWFKSYFCDRYQSVQINGTSSKKHPLDTGMPQGSVIGPFGFPPYTSPLSIICRQYGIQYHLYADDTQLYIMFSPPDNGEATHRLEACITEIRIWMKSNFLKLNDSKTEFLILGSHHQLAKVPPSSITIGDISVSTSSTARNIGAIFDCHLSMTSHVSSICQSCYIHLRNIGKIRKFLTPEATERLICAFVSSKLDFQNSLLYGLPKCLIRRLKMIQHNAARIVTQSPKASHITPILSSLHWLPIEFRIEYKIIILTFKALHGMAPVYLKELLKPYSPVRSLRSSDTNLLQENDPRTVKYGERAFMNCAPKLWNAMPKEMRLCSEIEAFKKDLKTYLFKKAFNV
jgi:hypothetical protein